MSDLAGKVAIVTGAGRGIGQAAALELARRGVRVCVADQNPDRADLTVGAISEAGGEAFAWQLDVSNKFQVSAMIEKTRDIYERLDLLVHNAHIQPRTPLLKMDEWDWRRTIEVNLTGAFYCGQLAARVMADENGGTIVFVVRDANTGEGAFGASQAGLTGLADHLAREIEPVHVAVRQVVVASQEQETIEQILDACQIQVRE